MSIAVAMGVLINFSREQNKLGFPGVNFINPFTLYAKLLRTLFEAQKLGVEQKWFCAQLLSIMKSTLGVAKEDKKTLQMG